MLIRKEVNSVRRVVANPLLFGSHLDLCLIFFITVVELYSNS